VSRWETQATDGTRIIAVAKSGRPVVVTLTLTRGSETVTAELTDVEAKNLGNNLGHIVDQA
jgi:hypothetical protein